jgi:hypothetical protein
MGWTWKEANPHQRGECVRTTAPHCFDSQTHLMKLFNLTANGLQKIMAGDQWRPEYEQVNDEQ